MKVKPDFSPKTAITLVVGMIALMLSSSCNRYTLYQNNATQGTSAASAGEPSERILSPGDKVSLSIWGHDDLSIGSIHTVYNSNEDAGKWLMIDDKGEVNLPQVGKFKIEGLTISKAEEKLVALYSEFIQKPILNLRLLSNQVTVLGEVQRPGNYIFHTDEARMVDIIGKASGFTDYAKTTEIKIIRGTETIVVNLTFVLGK